MNKTKNYIDERFIKQQIKEKIRNTYLFTNDTTDRRKSTKIKITKTVIIIIITKK